MTFEPKTPWKGKKMTHKITTPTDITEPPDNRAILCAIYVVGSVVAAWILVVSKMAFDFLAR